MQIRVRQANWDNEAVRNIALHPDPYKMMALIPTLPSAAYDSNFPVVAQWRIQGSVQDNLDLAFRFTNSVERAWFQERHSQLTIMTAGARSTSVGDIMEVIGNDGSTVERRYMVARCGFTEI